MTRGASWVTGAEDLVGDVVDLWTAGGVVNGRVAEVGVAGLMVDRHDTTPIQRTFFPWHRVTHVEVSEQQA